MPECSPSFVVAFCDLDGTLVLDNSFHVFLAAIWAKSDVASRLGFLAKLGPRLAGSFGGGHAGLKRRILLWFGRRPKAWQDAVVAHTIERLKPTLSAPIVEELSRLRASGARTVLATAAPDTYARPLAGAMGFDDCIATPADTGPGWAEMLGAEKARHCAQWLVTHLPEGARAKTNVLTDHPDDLPLLQMAEAAVLQGTTAQLDRLERAISERGKRGPPEIRRIDLLEPQEGGGYWLWFDDQPVGPLDAWEVKTTLSKHRHACIFAGAGVWRSVRPGQRFADAVRRKDCPAPPSSRDRLAIHLRRRVVRDMLGIFH